MLNVARSARSFRSNTPDRSRVTIASRKRLEDEEETSYWRSATFGVLLASAILATLVALMCFQVEKLSKQAESHNDVMELQIIILTEILRQLQIGKAINCSVCKMQWLQHKDSCYLFRERKMGWRSSMGFCRDEFSSLAVIHNDTEQMNFLRFESKKHFRQRHGKNKYYKFWMGLVYDVVTKQWKWADGSLYNPKMHGKLPPKGCAYLRNGSLFSQECEKLAYVMCQTALRFGWS
uniref:C-type lectin domain family 1 member A-like isoform X2 n=1 Tax=Podarcis muralis TaxID=64176 RepID=UPI00109FD814|nr:C-type lectin domain family 1 member A-like isoform X2 [Podarcis muralis]